MARSAVLQKGNICVVVTSRTGPHFAPELFRAAGFDLFEPPAARPPTSGPMNLPGCLVHSGHGTRSTTGTACRKFLNAAWAPAPRVSRLAPSYAFGVHLNTLRWLVACRIAVCQESRASLRRDGGGCLDVGPALLVKTGQGIAKAQHTEPGDGSNQGQQQSVFHRRSAGDVRLQAIIRMPYPLQGFRRRTVRQPANRLRDFSKECMASDHRNAFLPPCQTVCCDKPHMVPLFKICNISPAGVLIFQRAKQVTPNA